MTEELCEKQDKKRIRYCSTWLAAGAIIFSILSAIQTVLASFIPIKNEAIKDVIGYIPGLVILFLMFHFVLKGAKKRWPDAVTKTWAMPSKKVSPFIFVIGIFAILGLGLAGNMLGELLAPLLPTADTSAQSAMFTRENFVWLFISYAILPPLLEEMLCRGFAGRMLKGCGTLLTCLIAGIPFALMHLDVTSFLGNMIFGMVAGYFVYTYENVWIGVIAHFLNNGILVIIMIFFEENGEILFYVMVGISIVLAVAGTIYLIFSKKVVFERNTTMCSHPVRTAFAAPMMIILIAATVGFTALTIFVPGFA